MNTNIAIKSELSFGQELKKQRWDDHRLYHHSRINQSLHLISALSFLSTYILLFVNSAAAVFIGWFIAMWLRQVGHFFFEPKNFDTVNKLSHEEKEDIKVGFNLQRKIVLLSIWFAIPALLVLNPTLFGVFSGVSFLENLAIAWLALAGAAIAFRTLQLCYIDNAQTGLVWCTKILTDPFHDVKMYYKAPYFLAKGQRIDPMEHVS